MFLNNISNISVLGSRFDHLYRFFQTLPRIHDKISCFVRNFPNKTCLIEITMKSPAQCKFLSDFTLPPPPQASKKIQARMHLLLHLLFYNYNYLYLSLKKRVKRTAINHVNLDLGWFCNVRNLKVGQLAINLPELGTNINHQPHKAKSSTPSKLIMNPYC